MRKNSLVHVLKVKPNSPAFRAGLRAGDIVLTVNGEPLRDIIDYCYLSASSKLEITFQRPAKEGQQTAVIKKEEDESAGLDFTEDLFDGLKKCQNKCIFCFVDQLPKNLRSPLYVKDDDYRLSFLYGNYITLTNLTESDFQRITKERLSPLYVSIHTTNPELRKSMLKNKKAADILKSLQRLASHHIQLHGQIVLCPQINDQQELNRTLTDLVSLYPDLASLSVVPVGLTRYQNVLRLYTKQEAQEVIQQVKLWQAKNRKNLGSAFVFLADEFYLLAGERLPSYDDYEDFYQLDNGVGMVRRFIAQLREAIFDLPAELPKLRKVLVVTGVSMGQILKRALRPIKKKYPNLQLKVKVVQNNFLGNSVTVAGLLVGQDIEEQIISEKRNFDEILLPCSALRNNRFLDGYSIQKLRKRLSTKVTLVPIDGGIFLGKLLGLS